MDDWGEGAQRLVVGILARLAPRTFRPAKSRAEDPRQQAASRRRDSTRQVRCRRTGNAALTPPSQPTSGAEEIREIHVDGQALRIAVQAGGRNRLAVAAAQWPGGQP